MAAYRTRRFTSGILHLGRLGLCLVLLLVTLVTSATAQEEVDKTPEEYIEIVLDDPTGPEGTAAAAYLVTHPARPKTIELVGRAVDRAASRRNDEAAAVLAAVGMARGDATHQERVKAVLQGSDLREKVALLRVLAFSEEQSPMVASWLPSLVQAEDPDVRIKALEVQARYAELGKGSGLGTFLLLIVISLVALVLYGASFAKDLDPVKGKVLDWTARPMNREQLLKDIKAELEDPVSHLMQYFDDTTLSSAEVGGLLDLLSHFDEDRVHEKLYEYAKHKNDIVKSNAIMAMAQLSDQRWENVLADFLQSDDEVAQFAAAKALADRNATGYLPLLREVFEKTIPGSVQDGVRDAIERLEAAEARGMGSGGAPPAKDEGGGAPA